jgi:ABC-2 type transport system permease protein
MKGALTLASRETKAYFNSPVAYIFIVAFLLSAGILFFFVEGFFAAGRASMRPYFGLMPIILSILVPALTMRLWAEEKRQGTSELLLTMPFSDAELVLGKFLASMAVVGLAVLLSVPVALMVSMFGSFDPGPVFTEYLGVLLLACASTALGQMVSSASRNQMSAFMATAFILVAINLSSMMTTWLELPAIVVGVVNWISLSYHFISFSRGVLDTRDLVYFLLFTTLFLYLTARNLAAGRWR